MFGPHGVLSLTSSPVWVAFTSSRASSGLSHSSGDQGCSEVMSLSTPHSPHCRITCSPMQASHRSPDLGSELSLNSGTRAQDRNRLTSLPCCPTVSPPETAHLQTHTEGQLDSRSPVLEPKGALLTGPPPALPPGAASSKAWRRQLPPASLSGNRCLKANPALAVVSWLHSLMCLGRTHPASEPFPCIRALSRTREDSWKGVGVGRLGRTCGETSGAGFSSCSAMGAPSLLFSKTRQRRLSSAAQGRA